MSPLANALLGLVYLLAGISATLLMYYLRGGRSARPLSQQSVANTTGNSTASKSIVSVVETSGHDGPAGETRQADMADAVTTEGQYLARWRRSSDDREPLLKVIHRMAEAGKSIIEPMRTGKPTTSWDDLLIKGAQLEKQPLNDDQPVSCRTVIGPQARQPLVIETPIIVSHMSYGALSREAKTALAKGSAAVRTAICSGEGGMLEDEFQHAFKYIFEYVPNLYSVTDENLRRVDAIEIKIGQSAKPGMGGLLPGDKVSEEIAAVRGREAGHDIHSPARFPGIGSSADLGQLVDALRERSGGRPIGIKIAAGNVEADVRFAIAARPDFLTLDGRAGATGAAPKMVKDATSVPTINALCRVRRLLNETPDQQISLIVTGGLRVSSDFAKALALGADAVAIASAALMACGCQQYRLCNTGKCPVGIATQNPQLRERLQIDKSAEYLANFLRVSTEELEMFARLTGNSSVHGLSAADVCTTNTDLANATVIEHV